MLIIHQPKVFIENDFNDCNCNSIFPSFCVTFFYLGGQFAIVNGPTGQIGFNPNQSNEVYGYIIDLSSTDNDNDDASIIEKFSPAHRVFQSPHDVAISPDGNDLYVAEIDPPTIHKFQRKNVDDMIIHVAKNHSKKIIDNIPLKRITTNNKVPQDNIKKEDESSKVTPVSIVNTVEHSNDIEQVKKGHHPAGTAILVAFLMSFFIFLTFALAVFVARRRGRRGNHPTTIGGTLSIGQPNELVYRKLVDSNQQLASERK